MRTYKEHYEKCKQVYDSNHTPRYKSVYDLRIDNNFLDEVITDEYYDIVKRIRTKLDDKINSRPLVSESEWSSPNAFGHNVDCFTDASGHAIRINNWHDIPEVHQLSSLIMPVVEREILGCYGKVEFLHPYRNIPMKPWHMEKSSWMWHYDDCPDEFLKLFINLNEVTDNSGPLRYLQLADGEVPLIETFNTSVDYHKNGRRQVYPSSRIPSEVVEAELSRGGQIVSATGKSGSYIICTPNIVHKASVPDPNTEPRDVLFFFIRPSMVKYTDYLKDTNSYFPKKNVKRYSLD